MTNSPVPTFTVVMRCSDSLVRFRPDQGIEISPIETKYGSYAVTFQQREDKLDSIETPIPRELVVEARGSAPSLEVAIGIAGACGSEFVRQLGFGANAWPGIPRVHIAYGGTDGGQEHEFFQSWVVDERGLPRVAREVNPDLLLRLLIAIATMSERSRARVFRAIVQYTDALQHWKPGSELYALAHLYMGVEAITPLVIEAEVVSRGLKNARQLEKVLNGPPADSLKLRLVTRLYLAAGGNVASRLTPWARREVVFKGDKVTYRQASRASNQFEHGTEHHHELNALASQALLKTASYLREAVLRLIPLDARDREVLLSDPYGTPLAASGFERSFRGVIRSPDGQLAPKDERHPVVRWEFNLKHYARSASGGAEMGLSQKFTPRLGPDATLSINAIRFAGPTPTSHTKVESEVTRDDLPAQVVATKSGAELEIDPPRDEDWPGLVGRYVMNTSVPTTIAHLWALRLEVATEPAVFGMSISECVNELLPAVGADARIAVLLPKCEELWKEALDADALRKMLGFARLGKKGLVLTTEAGQVWEMEDPKQLSELVNSSTELVKKATAVLDEALLRRERTD